MFMLNLFTFLPMFSKLTFFHFCPYGCCLSKVLSILNIPHLYNQNKLQMMSIIIFISFLVKRAACYVQKHCFYILKKIWQIHDVKLTMCICAYKTHWYKMISRYFVPYFQFSVCVCVVVFIYVCGCVGVHVVYMYCCK